MRLFVAIEISEAVRRRAGEIVESARISLESALPIRWTPRENLHITLWFIGGVPAERAVAILAAIDPPVDVPPFDLHLGGLGAFPRTGAPRVVWLGVRQGGESLAAVHRELATRLRPLGMEPEPRPFSAHLTLGRVKSACTAAQGRGLRVAWQALAADAGTCRVEALTVFESRLSPRGAAYHPLLRVPLK